MTSATVHFDILSCAVCPFIYFILILYSVAAILYALISKYSTGTLPCLSLLTPPVNRNLQHPNLGGGGGGGGVRYTREQKKCHMRKIGTICVDRYLHICIYVIQIFYILFADNICYRVPGYRSFQHPTNCFIFWIFYLPTIFATVHFNILPIVSYFGYFTCRQYLLPFISTSYQLFHILDILLADNICNRSFQHLPIVSYFGYFTCRQYLLPYVIMCLIFLKFYLLTIFARLG